MTPEQNFRTLLNRYINDIATDAEKDELIDLIHSGKFKELQNDRIDAMLLDDSEHMDMPVERAQAILDSIISTEETKVVRLSGVATSRLTSWKFIAAAATLVIISTVGIWLYKGLSEVEVRQANNIVNVPTDSEAFSERQYVKLPDNSAITLNDSSQIIRHSGFGGDQRVVTLTGEAFFDIAHDPERPFKIITGDVTTVVRGTAFNIKATKSGVEVTVTRGRVEVIRNNKVLGVLTHDQQISVSNNSGQFLKEEISAKEVTAWKDRFLILDDLSLETAAVMIEEKYNVKIIFENPVMKQCRVSGKFMNDEELDQVLKSITTLYHASYTVLADGTVRLEGDGCN